MSYFKIAHLTGRSLNDCAFVILRSDWEDFVDDDTTEWLIVRRKLERMSIVATGCWLPDDLWMSPTGQLYFVGTLDGTRGLHHGRELDGVYQWRRTAEVNPGKGITSPHGVWGLSDDYVFCWGGGWLPDEPAEPDDAHLSPALTWFFDGRSWREISSPGLMLSVHGADRESIFTVGEKGLVARWDGSTWVPMARPAPVPLGHLHVVSADEAYAASAEGDLFEGSQHGWHEVASAGTYTTGLIKWDGRWIIATKVAGMLSMEQNRIVPFRRDLEAYVVNAGDTLMWADGAGILETKDFSAFNLLRHTEIGALVNADYFPY